MTGEPSTYEKFLNNMANSFDSFDQQIVRNTTNKADIASHYDHSPERHRLYINGSRFQLQYDSTTKFEDTLDSWTLKPASGDTMEYQTAERFRYVVGYNIVVSTALQVNQSLQTGDEIVVGYGDIDLANDRANADGWFIEFNDSHDLNEGDLLIYRDGEEKVRETVSFNQDYTDWKRYAQDLSWYNVGNNSVEETYTVDDRQFNHEVSRTAVEKEKATITGNHRVVVAVKAGSGTDNLQVDAGSTGVEVKGDVEAIVRAKAYADTGSHSGSGDWEPIHALRVDPSRDRVNTQISSLQVMETSSDTDVQVMALAFDPSSTDLVDGDFSAPPEHNPTNSVVQTAGDAAVTEIVDNSGAKVSATGDPGGYQLGYASRYVAGTGNSQRRTESTRVRKRNIYNGDYCVIMAKAGSSTDITFEVETEQDW